MSAWTEKEPEVDGYLPTLHDVAAALGLVLGALTFVAWRRWRWPW